MLPSLRGNGELFACPGSEDDARLVARGTAESSDTVDRNTGDAAGDFDGGRGREEEFVVFAAVKGEVEGFGCGLCLG